MVLVASLIFSVCYLISQSIKITRLQENAVVCHRELEDIQTRLATTQMKFKEEKQAATNDSLYYQQRMQENAVAYQNLESGIASLERRIDEESTNSRVLLETEKVRRMRLILSFGT